jgi:hypothetical protein
MKTLIQRKLEAIKRSRFNEMYRFLVLTGQLGLLLLVLRQFQIESNAFLRVAALAFGGFAIHYFLPHRFRPPFFLFLSLSSIAIVFGLLAGAWLVGIGLILIGICHLPLPFYGRVLVLLVAGGGLALLRVDWVQAPWSRAIWPILGSMFMFRLMVYLYDISNEKAPQSITQSLSYFFMLPNVCFPLFPVVDYKTFKRNYYNSDAHIIYQTGIDWMTRGVIHLILYRIIYYYFTIAPAEVAAPKDFAQFVVTSFLLYLRISGQFHLIIGMLHLFGFRLPETHHLYYLSSSFTDFWRRINIYWKDFMMKLFYYPLYFRLRGWGKTAPVVIATIFVFFATWVLHAYQWFWLRGSVLLTGPDMAFWGILAVLVIINSLYEVKYGRERTLTQRGMSFSGFTKRALRTAGTFCVISILWSLWQSETLIEWLSLWESVGNVASMDFGPAPILLVGGVIAGGLTGLKDRPLATKESWIFSLRKSPAANLVLLCFLGLMGIQGVYLQLGPTVATFINSLRSGKLSRVDVAMMEKGYYENLNRVERFNSQLWELYMNRPASWLDVVGDGLERFTGDFRYKELVPSFVVHTSHGRISTNRWGMRDKDYEKSPPPNTFRVALLGASSVMGWGVKDDATFEAILEQRLNAKRANKPYAQYEILNFAVPGYDPLSQLLVLDKAIEFNPSAFFYVATGREASRVAAQLAGAAAGKVPLPFDYLGELLQKAGLPPGTPESVATRRLMPFRDELLAWTYRSIVSRAHQRNIVPVLIFLPQVNNGTWKDETPAILRIAKEAGFTILDLSDVYSGQDINSIRVAEWDNHPNQKGHELVAARLYQLLNDNSQEILSAQTVAVN